MPCFGRLITLAVGVYAGIYVSQHYEIRKVESPKELCDRAKEYIESKEKVPPATTTDEKTV